MVLAAQNGVTVSGLAISAGTVTFNVSWQTPMPVELWSDTVWVFVDYNKNGVMERLPLLSGATLTATSPGGKVIEEPDNNKGVWVAGNARTSGSFSATVKLLTTVKDVGGACVYGSNYPPVGEYYPPVEEYSSDAPVFSFTGTPMYDIQLAKPGGGSVTVKSGDTFLLPCNYTLTSFTDATGAPGRLNSNTPPDAASTRIWVIGTQTWSAPLMKAQTGCTAVTNLETLNPPTAAYYRTQDLVNGSGYLYNWKCVNDYATQLCPYPWRMPTMDDFIALDKAFGGSGENRAVSVSWLTDNYITAWGGVYSGLAYSTTFINHGSGAYYYASSEADSSYGRSLYFNKSGIVNPQNSLFKRDAYQVRCVK
jgi:uncharacterized protein (TIGR02145 family)